MSAQKTEYYNLYVEFQNMESNEDEFYNTFAYTLLDRNVLNQYIDLIKRKSWGEFPVGKQILQVVPAHTIKIFDISNVDFKGDVNNRDELLKLVPLNPDTELTLFEQLERYGKDVTKEIFGEELETFLNHLQFELQIERRGINAQTGELGSLFTKGNTKGGSSVKADLTGKILPFFPNEFSEGIKDSSIEPAFEVKKVARVFADHIKNLKDESGQMAGVFGQWGRGKSYFINEVIKIYGSGKSSPFMMIKFQAWKYQNTQSIWAYLYETFIEEYLKVNWWNKWTRIFCLSINRNGHWKTWIWPLIGILIGVFAFSFTSTLTEDSERQLIIKIAGFVATLAISIDKGSSIMKKIKNPATSIFNSFSKAPSFKEVLGVQAEIQKELKNLIKAWSKKFNNKRILLFVDDLDRCSENQIIEIIDSLRVILDDELITKHILILVALDEKKLAKAIGKKYENLFSPEELPEIVAEYMDKLFISAVKLFPISFDDRAEFVEKLANQINLEDNKIVGVKTKLKSSPTKTPTLIPQTTSDAEPEGSPDSIQGTTTKSGTSPESTPALEPQKSSKNIEETEVTILQTKIKLAKNELTPRQIRILIYRYLLARNLWRIFYEGLDFKSENAVDEIMRFSGYSNEDSTAETKVYPGLSNIVRMVVAY